MAWTRVLALLVAPAWGGLLVAPGKAGAKAPKSSSAREGKVHENHYLDHTELDHEIRRLVTVLGAEGHDKAVEPVHEPDSVPYTPFTCKKLFAYKDTRDQCFKLQKLICGKDCQKLLPEGSNVTECTDTQAQICAVPKFAPPPKPIKLPNATDATLAICNAYPTQAKIDVQHDKYYALKDPKPFMTGLKYLDCKQVQVPPGEVVNIYLDNHPVGKHTCGAENAIIMVGQYALGEMKVGITVYAFKSEGYRRPIVCNAFPKKSLEATVAGRDWHPFVEAHHPRSLKYLECEKLNLDHADSQHDPEALEFKADGKVVGHVTISPVKSLYMVGAELGDRTALAHQEYDFASLRISK